MSDFSTRVQAFGLCYGDRHVFLSGTDIVIYVTFLFYASSLWERIIGLWEQGLDGGANLANCIEATNRHIQKNTWEQLLNYNPNYVFRFFGTGCRFLVFLEGDRQTILSFMSFNPAPFNYYSIVYIC